MLLPKRVKYRRVHRGRLTGKAMRGNTVTYSPSSASLILRISLAFIFIHLLPELPGRSRGPRSSS